MTMQAVFSYTIKTETSEPGAPTYTVAPAISSGTWTQERLAFTLTASTTAPVADFEYSTDNGTSWSSAGLSTFTVPDVQTNGTAYISEQELPPVKCQKKVTLYCKA